MWDVHTYGNDFWDSSCGMYIPMEMIGFSCLARSHTVPSWDPTSASSASRGVEAVGMESTSDGAKDPLDEAGRSSSAGLQAVCGIRGTLFDTKEIANHSGIRILTILPGAWPWAATPLRRRCRWSSSEEGFSPSWTLRPPSWGGLPFLLSPRWGRGFLLLLLTLVGGVGLGVIVR